MRSRGNFGNFAIAGHIKRKKRENIFQFPLFQVRPKFPKSWELCGNFGNGPSPDERVPVAAVDDWRRGYQLALNQRVDDFPEAVRIDMHPLEERA